MITYNPKSWFKLIFNFHRSDTLRLLWKELLAVFLFTFLLCFFELKYLSHFKNLDKLFQVYSLIGFVISLLLVFRTNTAYDRWWEGRKLWGQLVNDTRNFSIKINSLLLPENDKQFFAKHIINFVYATKEHLRKGVKFDQLTLDENEKNIANSKSHIPLFLSGLLFNKIQELKNDNKIITEDVLILERNLNGFMDVCGACERIKNTPIPYSYSLFIKKFIFIYTITLPLAFITTFGYYSAFISTFVFYALVSMEILAEEIEDPFGNDDNDLPTDDLAEKIKSNVIETFNS